MIKLKNDLNKNKGDHKDIISKILNTNESISKELEIYKEKYDYLKEKNLVLKKELNEIKSHNEKENVNESQKEKDFFNINPKKKLKNAEFPIETNSTRKMNINDSNNMNISPIILNRVNNINNNTGDSQFLDTTTKKLFANIPEDRRTKDDNYFIENLMKEMMKTYDIKAFNENLSNQCKNLGNEYNSELLVLQNKIKEKMKELFSDFVGKYADSELKYIPNDELSSKKSEKYEESDNILKMIENNTVFSYIDLTYNVNSNENYEFNAKMLKKQYDEKMDTIDKIMENYKSNLEAYFRKKIQNLKNHEIINNDCGRIPIVTITNEHHENLKILRTLYEEKIDQIEKKFFDYLKKITKEREK